MLFNLIVGMSIGQEEIHIAVIVIIEKLDTPTTHQPRDLANAVGDRHVVEAAILVVVVERIHLLVYVGDEKIYPTVLIIVGSVDAHSRTGVTFGIQAHVGLKAHLLKFSFAMIEKQEICHGVISNEEIHQ